MLKFPYPRDIQEPDIYEPIRIHGQYSKDVVPCAQPHLAVSEPLGSLSITDRQSSMYRVSFGLSSCETETKLLYLYIT